MLLAEDARGYCVLAYRPGSRGEAKMSLAVPIKPDALVLPPTGCWPSLALAFSIVSWVVCLIFYWPAITMSKTAAAEIDVVVGIATGTLGIVAASMVLCCNSRGLLARNILRVAIGFAALSLVMNIVVVIAESVSHERARVFGGSMSVQHLVYFVGATIFDVPLLTSLIMMHREKFWEYDSLIP